MVFVSPVENHHCCETAGIRALTWPRTACHPRDWPVRLQNLFLLLYCAIQVTVVQCELTLNKWHLAIIAVSKNGVWVWVGHCQDVFVYMKKFSVIDTDNLQNFLLIFYEICNLACNPFTYAIDVEFKFRKSVLAHAEPCWVWCVVERSDLAGVEDTRLPCVVIQCYGYIRVPWNLDRPTKLQCLLAFKTGLEETVLLKIHNQNLCLFVLWWKKYLNFGSDNNIGMIYVTLFCLFLLWHVCFWK